MLGNTLAASLIWGINTIFLLDAGLSNPEAFAANAFFTAGMVHLRGADRDRRRHRRAAHLLSARDGDADRSRPSSTSCSGRSRRRSGPGPSPRCCSASASPSSRARSRRGSSTRSRQPASPARSRPCSAAARWSPGVAMLTGSLAGGFIAAETTPRRPVRAPRRRSSLVMFLVAFRLMHDVGFTRRTRRQAPARDAEDRVSLDRVRLARARGQVADAGGPVHRRRRHLRLLRVAAVPARALRRPGGLPGGRARGGDRRRRPDPRWLRRSADPPPLPPPHLGADADRLGERAHPARVGAGRELLRRARSGRRLGPAVRGDDADPPGLHQRA